MANTPRATWLRVGYRVGAVADGIVAAAMLGQTIFAFESPLTHHTPDPAYRYAMGLAGSLMLGWTILLLWADRKPAGRRGVLWITIVAVAGLMGTSLYAASTGVADWTAMTPVLVVQACLIALFAYGLWCARDQSANQSKNR